MSAGSADLIEMFSLGTSDVVRFAPDGSHIAVLRTRKLLLVEPPTGEAAAGADMLNGADLDFSPAGDRVAAMDTSGRTSLFAIPGLELVMRIPDRSFGEGAGPVFSHDGTHVLQASWDGDLVVRETATGDVTHHVREPGRMITAITCDPSRQTVAYASCTDREAVVRLWRWPLVDSEARDIATMTGTGVSVQALALSGDGRLAIRERDALSVWNTDSDKQLARTDVRGSGTPEGLAWSPDGELAVTDRSTPDGKRVLGLDGDLGCVWSIELPYACSVSYSPCGELIALGSWKNGQVLRRPPK